MTGPSPAAMPCPQGWCLRGPLAIDPATRLGTLAAAYIPEGTCPKSA
ncbi:MAG: hypothetical protein R3F65_05625 [bacterium]